MVLKSNKYYSLILSTTILYSNPNILHAADYTWSGQNSSLWTDSTSWAPNGVPGAGDNVTLYWDLTDGNVLTLTTNATIENLVFDGINGANKPALIIDGGSLSTNQNISFERAQMGGYINLKNKANLSISGDLVTGKINGPAFITLESESYISQDSQKAFTLSDTAGINTEFSLTEKSAGDIGHAVFANRGSANISITDGSRLTARGIEFAKDVLGTATATVSGDDSTLTSDTDITLGVNGNASLTLADGATLQSQGNLTIAKYAPSNSTLIIGTGQDTEKNIILNVPEINFGAGTGNIIINSKQFLLNSKISGQGTLVIQNGLTRATKNIDSGIILNIKSGSKLIAGSKNNYINIDGNTKIEEGSVLSGYANLNNIDNSGILQPGDSLNFSQMIIRGNYTGSKDGNITLKTSLGDDNSLSDKLDIAGNTSGQSTITILNKDGTGAPTVNGIQIIKVSGQSDATMLLGNPDYTTPNEKDAIIAGAYAYTLEKGLPSADDGNWYLRSTNTSPPSPPTPPTPPTPPGPPSPPSPPGPPTPPAPPVPPTPPGPNPDPRYQPGVPLYNNNVESMRSINQTLMSSLYTRAGNRYWSGAGVYHIARGDGPGLGSQPPEAGTVVTDTGLFWIRTEAGQENYSSQSSTIASKYRQNYWLVQAGLDSQLRETESGRLIGSGWVHYIDAKSRSYSRYGDGDINTQAYGFGGALTWYGDNGFYVDAQTQVSWYKTDLYSDLTRKNHVSDHNNTGYGFGIEVGKRIQYNDFWSLTPQAQLTYSDLNLKDYTDFYDARVHHSNENDVLGRLGLATNYENAWQDAAGFTRKLDLYGMIGVQQNFTGNSNLILVSGTPFYTGGQAHTQLQLTLGSTYSWNDGKYAVFGTVETSGATKNISDNYSLSGNLGFKIRW